MSDQKAEFNERIEGVQLDGRLIVDDGSGQKADLNVGS